MRVVLVSIPCAYVILRIMATGIGQDIYSVIGGKRDSGDKEQASDRLHDV